MIKEMKFLFPLILLALLLIVNVTEAGDPTAEGTDGEKTKPEGAAPPADETGKKPSDATDEEEPPKKEKPSKKPGKGKTGKKKPPKKSGKTQASGDSESGSGAESGKKFSIGTLAVQFMSDKGPALEKDGSDDWKLIGDGQFGGDKIYSKKGAKPTMKDLNKAYRERIAELDTQMPGGANPTKKRIRASIVAARNRLRHALKAKALVKRLDKVHKQKAVKGTEQQLKIIGWEGATQRDLLRSRQYNEAALQKKHEELLGRLNPAGLGFAPELKKAAQGAQKYVNDAFKELQKFAVVNNILTGKIKNQIDRDAAFGYHSSVRANGGSGGMAKTAGHQQRAEANGGGQGQQHPLKELAKRYRERLQMIRDLRKKFEKELKEAEGGGGKKPPKEKKPEKEGEEEESKKGNETEKDKEGGEEPKKGNETEKENEEGKDKEEEAPKTDVDDPDATNARKKRAAATDKNDDDEEEETSDDDKNPPAGDEESGSATGGDDSGTTEEEGKKANPKQIKLLLKTLTRAEDKLLKMYQETVFMNAVHGTKPGASAHWQPMNGQIGMGSKPGDNAKNCLDSIQHCFDKRFHAGMQHWCGTTCRELGKDGRDVGKNCAQMKRMGMCTSAENKFVMSKLCAATCR